MHWMSPPMFGDKLTLTSLYSLRTDFHLPFKSGCYYVVLYGQIGSVQSVVSWCLLYSVRIHYQQKSKVSIFMS